MSTKNNFYNQYAQLELLKNNKELAPEVIEQIKQAQENLRIGRRKSLYTAGYDRSGEITLKIAEDTLDPKAIMYAIPLDVLKQIMRDRSIIEEMVKCSIE